MSSPEGLSMIWLIPGFPILAAILLTLWPTHQSAVPHGLAIGAMALNQPSGSEHCLSCDCERSRRGRPRTMGSQLPLVRCG